MSLVIRTYLPIQSSVVAGILVDYETTPLLASIAFV